MIMDTDMGICNDDCLALFLGLSSAELKLEGISVCAGNYSQKQCLRNLLSLMEYLQKTEIPVYQGAELPLKHRCWIQTASAFGAWWDVERAVWPFGNPANVKPRGVPAWEWMSGVLSDPAAEISLVAIGPLTNIALAVEKGGPFPALKEIIIMGGLLDWLPGNRGNATDFAEFNFWVDPEAAEIVLDSGYPVKLIPLNLWQDVWFDLDCFLSLCRSGSRIGRLTATVLKQCYLVNPDYKISFGDALAVGALLWPELFEFRRIDCSVRTEPGPEYGMLEARLSPGGDSSVQGMVELDGEGFISRYLAALGGSGRVSMVQKS